MSYFHLAILVYAAISTAAAGCTVQKIESQPLPAIRTEVEQAYRHETGQLPPPHLPVWYRMQALLDSALERAYQSPCDNDVVFYYASHFGWSMSCDRCLDYSGSPWRYLFDYAAPPWRHPDVPANLLAELKTAEQRGLRRRRYVRYPDLMEQINVCPLPPDDSARRVCLERAGWVPPLPDRKWKGASWVVCE